LLEEKEQVFGEQENPRLDGMINVATSVCNEEGFLR
jgi:hypothetical protein